jgi:adenine-specific DNA-methyltransferase
MIEEMADYTPGQIILVEHSLADLSAMRNAHYVLRDRNIELKLV